MGVVCIFFKVKSVYRWFEKMELLIINVDFIFSVIFVVVMGVFNVCLGFLIVISCSIL